MIFKFIVNNIVAPAVTSMIAQPVIEAVVNVCTTAYRMYVANKNGTCYVRINEEKVTSADLVYTDE